MWNQFRTKGWPRSTQNNRNSLKKCKSEFIRKPIEQQQKSKLLYTLQSTRNCITRTKSNQTKRLTNALNQTKNLSTCGKNIAKSCDKSKFNKSADLLFNCCEKNFSEMVSNHVLNNGKSEHVYLLQAEQSNPRCASTFPWENRSRQLSYSQTFLRKSERRKKWFKFCNSFADDTPKLFVSCVSACWLTNHKLNRVMSEFSTQAFRHTKDTQYEIRKRCSRWERDSGNTGSYESGRLLRSMSNASTKRSIENQWSFYQRSDSHHQLLWRYRKQEVHRLHFDSNSLAFMWNSINNYYFGNFDFFYTHS